MIQHVALEIRRDDVDADLHFWWLLGFERVIAPPALAERSAWVQAGATQIHLLYADEPAVPPEGHVAVVAADYEATLDRLRSARLRAAAANRVLGFAARVRKLSNRPSGRGHGLRAGLLTGERPPWPFRTWTNSSPSSSRCSTPSPISSAAWRR